MLRHRPPRGVIAFLIAILAFSPVLSATEHYGQVGFTGLAVPGAKVTAIQGDKQIITTTDQGGLYRFPDLSEGTWTITIEMRVGSTVEGLDIRFEAGAETGWECAALFQGTPADGRRRHPYDATVASTVVSTHAAT